MLTDATTIVGTHTANQAGIYELIPKAEITCDVKYTVNPVTIPETIISKTPPWR